MLLVERLLSSYRIHFR